MENSSLKKSSFAILLLIALFAFGCSSQTVDDAAITTEVKSKLAMDDNTSAFEIGVETEKGVVNLSGTVATTTEKTRAEEIAKQVEGVSSVVNNIRVEPETASANDEAESDGDMFSDATILTKIKSQLLAEAIIGTNVDVTDGKVIIKGEVENAQEKRKAEEIAKKTDGVISVKNELVIKKS